MVPTFDNKLNLLHLSDIHFRKTITAGHYDLDEDLRNELERDAKRIVESKSIKLNGILITGDLAFAGKSEEYDFALKWLENLCGILGCPNENVWTVPGNHDVDRSIIDNSQLIQLLQKDLRGTSDIDSKIASLMKDHSAKSLLYDPLAEYNIFAARFGCDINADKSFWEQDLYLNDGSILRLRGLNTTLISSSKDNSAENKLILGTIQSKPKNIDGVTYLSLSHHPPQWLRDEDDVSSNLETRVKVQLFGHKHKQKVDKINNCVRITAGAVHPSRNEPGWIPRYNFISLEVETKNKNRELKVFVYPRVWSEEEGLFKSDFSSDGSEIKAFSLSLGAWTPVLDKNETSKDSNNTTKKKTNDCLTASTKPAAEEVLVMNKARRLVYRFYSLPYDARIEVARRLHLSQKEDESLQGSELFNKLLQRAKDNQKLEELWDEVQKEHGDGLYLDNPFAS